MTPTFAQSNAMFIDSEADLLTLLESIANLAADPPALYLDLEGNDLGRHGSISILSLYIAPTQKTYLIDIHSLGMAAFSTTNNSGTSLKTILESSTIPKVIFDIRNKSDALFHLFQISVDGIKDLQIMELPYRTGSREILSCLAQCIEKESSISVAAKTEWSTTEEHCHGLFGPKKDGHHEISNERPLKPEIIQYCKQNVVLLPSLYDAYNTKLCRRGEAYWRLRVRETTEDRVTLSQSLGYNWKSANHDLGWDDHAVEEDIESWNDILMMETLAGTHVLNENDEWVLAPDDDFDDFWWRGRARRRLGFR